MFFDPASSSFQVLPPAALKGASGGPPARTDLHRLKINGLPAGSFTDARLRQLFSIVGQVILAVPAARRGRRGAVGGAAAAV